ncbi:acyl-CoA dehydrogenase family protein [Streptomyces chromofuscus]|uniref:acyl-CoA dehydrogenase family protein n=1 Tax=Streptomyces chromofuscus TaxID=42881 RepID=UPI001674C4CB|nr:acyl-CoA dehydrogenase family protein [Streptomyces chromofuscus]GGT43315.1 acyl-CoA dehydrogenase [Streptomyces chromofuscus]
MPLVESVAAVLPVLRDHARSIDERASFPVEGLSALRKTELMGLLVPTEYGGVGGSLQSFVDIAQELATACLSTASIWAMHCQQVGVLARYGTQALREAVLPDIAAGKVYVASITTEAGKGGHLLSAQAALAAHQDALHISRNAPVVTGGAFADGFLITMRSDPEARSDQVSLVYAERAQLRIEESGDWNTMGMRGTHSLALTLEGEVPTPHLVGAPGGFQSVAVEVMIPLAHLGWSACWLGAARGAFAELVGHLTAAARKRKTDLTSDLLRERLARIRLDLELVHSYLKRVCAEIDEAQRRGETLSGPAVQIHINSLKLAASELTFRAVDRMVELAGLWAGYSKDSPLSLERTFRDLRSASLNYANDRLWTANGTLTLLDRAVNLA